MDRRRGRYQPHWSLIAPQRSGTTGRDEEAWVRTPIDRFVLAKFEASGLSPAPEADRRSPARRVRSRFDGVASQTSRTWSKSCVIRPRMPMRIRGSIADLAHLG